MGHLLLLIRGYIKMRAHEFIIIEDLIEPEELPRPVSTPFNLTKLGRRSQDSSSGGAYAQGTADPQDPSMYRKKSRMPSILRNDAYYQYIKATRPYVDSNPFFPRVYKIIMKRDPVGYVKPEFHIEKLHDSDAVDSYYDDKLDEILFRKYASAEGRQEFHGRSFMRLLSRAIIAYEAKELIKDPKLIEAIELIQKVKESNDKFSFDLHSGNIMFRLGSTGPELVFTDPIHDMGESIIGYNPFH